MVAYSFRPRFVEPIRIGLGLPLSVEGFAAGMDEFGNAPKPKPKLQTIRAVGNRRHARPGETLQLYTGMRTRRCRKIGEARCVSVDTIVINVYDTKLEILRFAPDPVSLDAFARADGFENVSAMHAFWAEEHGLGFFKGVLIKWEPI